MPDATDAKIRNASRELGAGAARRRLSSARIVVLAGGVGAARFLSGLVAAAPDAEITVIGNTGDDFKVHGLHVSPDLDSVAYTLANIGDADRGWGLRGESWAALGQLGRLGAETWFQLGDLDLAMHILRTERLHRGRPLSEVTRDLTQRLELPVCLLPMTDQGVATRIHTTDGRDLHIQEYLVREACQPEIATFEFRGPSEPSPARAYWRRSGRRTWSSWLPATRSSQSGRSWPCPESARRWQRRLRRWRSAPSWAAGPSRDRRWQCWRP